MDNRFAAHSSLAALAAFFSGPFAQVADLFAFVFRRYAELAEYGAEPVYAGEKDDIDPLVELLAPQLISLRELAEGQKANEDHEP